MRVKFVGAVGHVTGSCTLLDYPRTGIQFLIDCGMSQGEPNSVAINKSPLNFEPRQLSFVLLTHAHIDHCGLIPRLYMEGFTGLVICTRFTADLARFNLYDAAGQDGAPFAKTDVDKVRFSNIDDRTDFGLSRRLSISNDLFVAFLRSAHIGGACAITLSWKGPDDNWVEIVFSADVGNNTKANSYQPLLAHRQNPYAYPKYIVLESTYGDRVRDSQFASFENRTKALAQIVHLVIQERRGPLVIPCFSIHRTQEFILDLHYVLETLLKDEGDSPPFLKSSVVEIVLTQGLHAKHIDGDKGLLAAWTPDQRNEWLSSFKLVEIEGDDGVLQRLYIPVDQTQTGLAIAREKLRALRRRDVRKLKLCVDSPLAQRMTGVYRRELKRRQRHNPDEPIYRNRQLIARLGLGSEAEVDALFDLLYLEEPGAKSCFKSYDLVFCQPKESFDRLSRNETLILLTGSGMCDGGPIIRHLATLLPNENATIVLTGYAPPSSIAGKLRAFPSMAKELRETEYLELGDKAVPYTEIKAHIEDIGPYYSGHADQNGLLDFLFEVVPGNDNEPSSARVFLNHGDDRKRKALADVINRRNTESKEGERRVLSVEMPHKDQEWYDLDADAWVASTARDSARDTDLLHEVIAEQRRTNILLSQLVDLLENPGPKSRKPRSKKD